LLEGDGDGGFAAGGEAREPDCEALLAAEGGADGGGYRGGVVGDVAGHVCKFGVGEISNQIAGWVDLQRSLSAVYCMYEESAGLIWG